MWPNLIAKAKEGGLDVIQTYVFWNLHEPQQGQVTKLKPCLLVYIFFFSCIFLKLINYEKHLLLGL